METTSQLMNELSKVLGDRYVEELKNFPFKKNVRECLIDGYRQGVGDGIRHAVQMLGVTVKE